MQVIHNGLFPRQVNVLLSKKQLQEEITHLENSTRLRAQASQGWIEEDDLKTSRRDSTDLYCESDLLRLLLKWCKIVCRLYGSKVRETGSFKPHLSPLICENDFENIKLSIIVV